MTFTYPAPCKEAHHTKPRYLLNLYDRAHEADGLDAEDLEAWLLWECEALAHGIDPDNTTREELVRRVEDSVIYIPREEHRRHHSSNGDFRKWGRQGGTSTLKRYGRPWYVLLARYRWHRATLEDLASYREECATA